MCVGKKIKEFEISMVCYNLDNKYTSDQINDMFVDWAESKDIYIGGSIKPCEGETQPDTTSKCNKQNVSNAKRTVCGHEIVNRDTDGNYYCRLCGAKMM